MVLLAVPGMAVGVLLAVAFARVMKTFVYGVAPADPISIGAAAGLLLAIAVFSAWAPARRAAATDPATALRSE